jgi:hypothetical protein
LRRLAAAALAALLAGCVHSLEPFYSKEMIVAAPVSNGEWQIEHDGKPDPGTIWRFTGDRVTMLDKHGHWREFKVTYFKVGDALFLDSIADTDGGDPSLGEGYWQMHLVPFHMLARVQVRSDRLVLRPLTAKGFEKAIGDAPSRQIVKRGEYETMVFDATPAQWKVFLEKHGNDSAVFPSEGQISFVPAK